MTMHHRTGERVRVRHCPTIMPRKSAPLPIGMCVPSDALTSTATRRSLEEQQCNPSRSFLCRLLSPQEQPVIASKGDGRWCIDAQVLGRGATSVVHHGYDSREKLEIAVKIIDLVTDARAQDIKQGAEARNRYQRHLEESSHGWQC